MSPARLRRALATACALLLAVGDPTLLAQEKPPEQPPAKTEAPGAAPEVAPKIPEEQLDSLVAPIALYPDDLLAQTLVASTYPLEIVQLQQWMAKNTSLKDKALADAVAKQPWDPSIQSMAAFPEVVKRLADDVQWTTDLGNAFLAQQSDVMDAVQRMRKKAKDKGALESNEHQKVETEKVEDKTVIIIEPTDPEVIYVPSYSPTVVYGPPVYPYPPIYYPYYPPGAAFVSFSFGVMWGAAIWGGSCCGCGWGGNDIDINVDNNFNRNTNIDRGDRNQINTGDRGNRGGGSRGEGGKWSHNPSHRGGTPYSDRATANKYGGSARGDSPSASNRASAGNRASASGGAGVSNRASGGAGSRPSTPSAGNRAASGGGDRIGSRDIPKSSTRSSGFGGGSGGYSRSSARSSSSRGMSSMGSRGGGGFGGGGMRGGGGGGRR
jgi:hypothetical protein